MLLQYCKVYSHANKASCCCCCCCYTKCPSLVPRRSRPLTGERKVRTRAWEPVCVVAGDKAGERLGDNAKSTPEYVENVPVFNSIFLSYKSLHKKTKSDLWNYGFKSTNLLGKEEIVSRFFTKNSLEK